MNGLKYVLLIHVMEHEELAEKLGVKKSYIDNRVAGRSDIPQEYSKTLMDIFNIPIRYFNEELTEENIKYILEHSKSCGVITGLEYVLNIYEIQNKDFAEILGINKQIINLWKKKKQGIPSKYIPGILEILGGTPSKYLQKELTIEDMKDLSTYIDMKKNILQNKEFSERIIKLNREVMKKIINNVPLKISSDLLDKIEELSQRQQLTVDQQIIKILSDYFKE